MDLLHSVVFVMIETQSPDSTRLKTRSSEAKLASAVEKAQVSDTGTLHSTDHVLAASWHTCAHCIQSRACRFLEHVRIFDQGFDRAFVCWRDTVDCGGDL